MTGFDRRLSASDGAIFIQMKTGDVITIDESDETLFFLYRWRISEIKSPHIVTKYLMRMECKKGVKNKAFLFHREILSPPPGFWVDHINGDTLNNRRCNLRIATPSNNNMNRRPSGGDRPTIYKGVTFNKRRSVWVARITKDRICKYIGRYASDEDAARAYDVAALALFGEFARLNFPVPS